MTPARPIHLLLALWLGVLQPFCLCAHEPVLETASAPCHGDAPSLPAPGTDDEPCAHCDNLMADASAIDLSLAPGYPDRPAVEPGSHTLVAPPQPMVTSDRIPRSPPPRVFSTPVTLYQRLLD